VTVLTHCNAGALARRSAWCAAREAGKRVQVYACETRPFLQGARLTAWELVRDHIPVTLITDGTAAHCMARGLIDCVVVGADRVAANGDVANKIGTYAHAVVAKRHGIPFYVAAPTTTIDLTCPDGSGIPIEERASDEVTTWRQRAPRGGRPSGLRRDAAAWSRAQQRWAFPATIGGSCDGSCTAGPERAAAPPREGHQRTAPRSAGRWAGLVDRMLDGGSPPSGGALPNHCVTPCRRAPRRPCAACRACS
jgi:hypothetical protein